MDQKKASRLAVSGMLLAGVLIAALLYGPRMILGTAEAAVQGDNLPAMTYGAVNVGVTATLVPAAPMSTRNALAVKNMGPNYIFCGSDSNVTTATGWPVEPNGGVFAPDVRYDSVKLAPRIYCVTTVLQVSPFNTRYTEVK